MATIVYIDEELPEITFREWVSLEDELEPIDDTKKIGINVFSETELIDPFFLLLQKEKESFNVPVARKVEAMMEIHRRLFEPTPEPSIVPIYSIQRKNLLEEETFVNDYDQAIQMNYALARDEMKKLFFGYESIDSDSFPQAIPFGELELETNDHTVLLPKDPIGTAHLKGIKTYRGISSKDIRFRELTLNDRQISQRTPWKTIPFTGQSEEEFQHYESLFRHPDIQETLSNLSEITDLYELWKTFMNEGIDLHHWTLKEWDALQERLESFVKKDKEVFENLKAKAKSKASPIDFPSDGSIAFYEIQKEWFQRMMPLLEPLKQSLLELYRMFMESIPPSRLKTNALPKTIYDLANAIQHPDLWATTVDVLKAHMLNERIQTLDAWIQSIDQWNGEVIEENLNHQLHRIQLTQTSIRDEPQTHWLSILPEIKNIKRGSVLVTETSDVKTADSMFDSIDDFLMEQEDPDEIPIVSNHPIIFLELIQSLNAGPKELLEIALPMWMEVQKASGLPGSIEEIYPKMPLFIRETHISQLKHRLPELEEETLMTLWSIPVDQWMDRLEGLVPSTMVASVNRAFEEYRRSFHKELFTYLNQWMVQWICDLQHQVLSHQFQFNIWQGSLNCIQAWSPYGVPMEGLKTSGGSKKEGMVNYLICILLDLASVSGSLWKVYAGSLTREEILQSWIHLFETEFKDTVDSLQDQFKTFEKEPFHKSYLEKGNQIRKQISETVEQRQKARYLSDYMTFLTHLPSVLIQSSIAKKIHLGCCLQLLNEKYRSDVDWSSAMKEAYKIKKLFATQRTGILQRPSLAQWIQPPSSKEVLEFHRPTEIPYETVPLNDVSTQWDVLKPFMPMTDHQLLIKGIRHLVPILEKTMSVYRFTFHLPVSFEEDFYQLSIFDLKALYFKVRQIQYKWIPLSDDQDYLKERFQVSIWETLEGYFNEVQEQSYKRLLQYFILRQLCFPALPEHAQANVLVIPEQTVSGDLIKHFGSKVYGEVAKWIQQRLFPTRTDFKTYISERREQENLEKLNIIDQMTPEERRDYVENKKLGLSELMSQLERYKEMPKRERPDIEMEGEEEFYPRHGENPDEMDPDGFNDEEY